MRILFVNRDPQKWFGGDMVQLNHTLEELRKLGFDCQFNCRPDTAQGFDLVHCFHLNFEWTEVAGTLAQQAGIPLVISANFYPEDDYGVSFERMAYWVNYAKAVIVLSENERQEMMRLLKVDGSNIHVIPNGIDTSVFYPDPSVVCEDYVMGVGRIADIEKGSHLLVQACRAGNFPLLWVGVSDGTDRMGDYAKRISQATPQQMADLYRRARVVVCPSLSERQSLVMMEAAACGCPVVDSVFNRGGDIVESVKADPLMRDELVEAIRSQWNAPRRGQQFPSWADIALRVSRLYV